MTRSELFWSHVQKSDGCWLWDRPTQGGYGYFASGKGDVSAHRAAWRFTYGEIPAGLWVLHRCDNPPCVRPDHLFLGTRSDNVRDCVAKGRHRGPSIGYRARMGIPRTRRVA